MRILRLLNLGNVFMCYYEAQRAVDIKPIDTNLKPSLSFRMTCIDAAEVITVTRYQPPNSGENQTRFLALDTRFTDFEIVLAQTFIGTDIAIGIGESSPRLVDGDNPAGFVEECDMCVQSVDSGLKNVLVFFFNAFSDFLRDFR